MLFFVLFRVVWMDGVRHVRSDEERFREALFDDITLSSTTVTTVTTINQNGGTYLFHSLDGNGKHINSTQGGLLSLHRQHDSINSNSNSN